MSKIKEITFCNGNISKSFVKKIMKDYASFDFVRLLNRPWLCLRRRGRNVGNTKQNYIPLVYGVIQEAQRATQWAVWKIWRMWKLSTTFKNSLGPEKCMRYFCRTCLYLVAGSQLVWHFVLRHLSKFISNSPINSQFLEIC